MNLTKTLNNILGNDKKSTVGSAVGSIMMSNEFDQDYGRESSHGIEKTGSKTVQNVVPKIIPKIVLMLAGVGIWNLGAHFGAIGRPTTAHAQSMQTSMQTPMTSAEASTSAQSAPLAEASGINIFANLSKQAIPSVVNISTISTVKMANRALGGAPQGFPEGLPENFFEQFFGGGTGFPQHPGFRGQKPPERKTMALGSGFIVDPSGIIMTNNHVVAGADEIKIQFTENPDEEPTPGKVIGRDPDLDVALIQVKTPRKLIALPLGDSDALNVGEYVMAVGNPYGQGHSVSHGIVSAKGRLAPGLPIANYLQVDAPINPGNSGGPLLNLKGEVVGINDAIDPRAQGIGFAIPINFIKKVLAQLETNGKVSRAYIGAVVSPMTPEIAEHLGDAKDLHAPVVTQVEEGSPAEIAGLQPYDAITEVNGSAVHTPTELIVAISSSDIGKSIPLTIDRAGKVQTLAIKPREKPAPRSVADARSPQWPPDEER
jgi:serine protease Do